MLKWDGMRSENEDPRRSRAGKHNDDYLKNAYIPSCSTRHGSATVTAGLVSLAALAVAVVGSLRRKQGRTHKPFLSQLKFVSISGIGFSKHFVRIHFLSSPLRRER